MNSEGKPDNLAYHAGLTAGESVLKGLAAVVCIGAFGALSGIALGAGILFAIFPTHPWFASIAASVSAVGVIAAGCYCGFYRAAAEMAAHMLRHSTLAEVIVTKLLERLLNVDEQADSTHGERGNLGAVAGERVPLRQCEERLDATLDWAMNKTPVGCSPGGWVRRWSQWLLRRLIRKITLAELRRDDSQHGGVDVLKVRDRIAKALQEELPESILSKARLVTALCLIGGPAVAGALTWLGYRWWIGP